MFFIWLMSATPSEPIRRKQASGGKQPPASPEPPNEALISRIAAGDPEAFAAFYRQTEHAVYGFIRSILKNRHDAEDVLQDTYLQISRYAASYQPQGKPMAWVLTIARNLARMRLRKQSQSTPVDFSQLEGYPSGEDPEADEDRMMLDSALRLLDDQERQVVLLHAVSGLKHRETAALLELPLSTVLSKYSRALARLKKYWNEGGTER